MKPIVLAHVRITPNVALIAHFDEEVKWYLEAPIATDTVAPFEIDVAQATSLLLAKQFAPK